MALFGSRSTRPFRTRGPQRDHDTDAARASGLCAFLDGLRADLERERDGLRGRYESVTTRAAFSQQALEDERAGAGMSSAVEELTGTMIRYTRRLAALEEQIAFVTDLRGRAALFPQQNEAVAASAGSAGERPA
jgi:hypothetical protein